MFVNTDGGFCATILPTRIGLFTDAYHPSTNGITVVVDIMKNNLETLGHEVYVVVPAASLRWWLFKERHVIRLPSLRGLFFGEYLTSVFFPPKQAPRIKRLNFDAIIIFTPAQVGLMGAYCALTQGLPLLWCDEGVNEILVDKKSGLYCKNTPQSFAKHAIKLLGAQGLRYVELMFLRAGVKVLATIFRLRWLILSRLLAKSTLSLSLSCSGRASGFGRHSERRRLWRFPRR